ncbi:MAG TPA: DUF4340 domain-containing protein [Polyangiaceae bacterium]|jgi:hypothetical protein|nr:DUF4340 domain-containing protein [Polyangiaceae bacterium]
MSRDKLIIGGVVVLAVLGGAVYMQSKKDAALGAPTVTAADFPTIDAPDDVDKLSITNGDKPEVVLEKVADPSGTPVDGGPPTKWVMTKPVKAEANQQAVTDLLANLKSLKVESKVNLKLDDEVRKDKQLDAVKGVHVVAWKGADKKTDEVFGKSGAAGNLVVAASQPDAVYAAKGYSSYLYAKEPKDFRQKEIFKFDDANVTEVALTNSHGAFAFKKGDKWTGTFGGKAIPRFDEEKAKSLVTAYKALNADDFGDGKSLSDTGLDKPEATLAFHLKDGSAPTILVGNVSTGTNRWVKKSDDDTIYSITSYAADWATGDLPKFQAAADAGAPDAGGKKK